MSSVRFRVVRIAKILCIAICFLTYYIVLVYSELYQPRNFGLELRADSDAERARIVVAKALSNFPASRAGIAVGDQVLRVDGASIRKLADWNHINARRELDCVYSFSILRGKEAKEIRVTLAPQSGGPVGWFERKRGVQAFLLLTALIVALANSSNPIALTGALLLAGIGTAPAFPGSEMTAIWRNLPTPIGAMLWIPQSVHLLLLPLLFTFFAMIPTSLFATKRGWLMVWGPGALLAAWCLPRIYQHIYQPGVPGDLPGAFHFAMSLAILFYGLGALTAFWINYARIREVVQQNRLRVLGIGSTLGLLPLIFFLAAIFAGTITQSPLIWFFVSDPFRRFTLAAFTLFPISLLYSILRQGLLHAQVGKSREVAIRLGEV